MKSIELTGNKDIKVVEPDKTSHFIRVPGRARRRQIEALSLAASFFARNTEQVLKVLGGNEGEQADLIQDDRFTVMVHSVRDSRLSRKKFQHDLALFIENSPSSPELSVGRTFALGYTDFVYSEVRRLKIESNAKK